VSDSGAGGGLHRRRCGLVGRHGGPARRSDRPRAAAGEEEKAAAMETAETKDGSSGTGPRVW
jgi:hypothetical protein